MSLLRALLRDFEAADQAYLLDLVARGVAADRDAAAAGRTPRQVDVGSRTRTRRLRPVDTPAT